MYPSGARMGKRHICSRAWTLIRGKNKAGSFALTGVRTTTGRFEHPPFFQVCLTPARRCAQGKIMTDEELLAIVEHYDLDCSGTFDKVRLELNAVTVAAGYP